MPTKHTFLFEEGLWTAKGDAINAENIIVAVDGETRVTHRDGLWVNDGYMTFMGEERTTVRNRYEIAPFEEGMNVTSWISDSPALGRLIGVFTLIEDSIMSAFVSKDGAVNGFEFFVKVDDTTYRNRGYCRQGDTLLSSWAVELKRVTK
jgi:hypothetical protein